MLRIGIDFDNTLTNYPRRFKELQGERFIITSRETDIKDVEALLKRFEITATIVTPNFKTNTHSYHIRAAAAKAEACYNLGIDIFFDDDIRVLKTVKEMCPQTICCMVI